jgi:hypothetical protein
VIGNRGKEEAHRDVSLGAFKALNQPVPEVVHGITPVKT